MRIHIIIHFDSWLASWKKQYGKFSKKAIFYIKVLDDVKLKNQSLYKCIQKHISLRKTKRKFTMILNPRTWIDTDPYHCQILAVLFDEYNLQWMTLVTPVGRCRMTQKEEGEVTVEGGGILIKFIYLYYLQGSMFFICLFSQDLSLSCQ